MAKQSVTVRTHKGYFVEDGDKKEYLFITVKNNYPKKSLRISSIFVMDDMFGTKERTVWIHNKDRQLPFILKAGRTWETWIRADAFEYPPHILFDRVVVESYSPTQRLKVFQSIEDENVAPSGSIPDGTW